MITYYIISKSLVFYIELDDNQFLLQEAAENIMLDKGFNCSDYVFTTVDPNMSNMVNITSNYLNNIN